MTSGLLTILATVSCGGKQVYDANIVATMAAYSVRRIVTVDAADSLHDFVALRFFVGRADFASGCGKTAPSASAAACDSASA